MKCENLAARGQNIPLRIACNAKYFESVSVPRKERNSEKDIKFTKEKMGNYLHLKKTARAANTFAKVACSQLALTAKVL